ncbi:MAG: NTP transferase domain-containing protein [Bdellovibrionales bacterium]|nr:NTP transferase domain-containing protein [Bdellovibrionales bacterium]
MTERRELYGLVLTGGRSRRMGSDKALIPYQGVPHALYLRELLRTFCAEVFLSARKAQWVGTPLEGAPLLEDVIEDVGPMGGLITALRFRPKANWVVLACDLPHVGSASIQDLIGSFDPQKMATCYANADEGFPEPLFAIYTPQALGVFENALQEGLRCPVKVLGRNDVRLIEAKNAGILSNANTPEDSKRAGLALPASLQAHEVKGSK